MSEPSAAWSAFRGRALAIHREDPTGHAERYHDTVVRYVEQLASRAHEPARDALLIAAMCQHIRRASIPRDTYPRTTPGYKRWRSELGRMHAKTARELALEAGFEEEVATRAEEIILHKALKRDADGMRLEDAVCLTFVALELTSFASGRSDEEVLSILRKTWNKMSEAGHALALSELDGGSFDEASSSLLRRALT